MDVPLDFMLGPGVDFDKSAYFALNGARQRDGRVGEMVGPQEKPYGPSHCCCANNQAGQAGQEGFLIRDFHESFDCARRRSLFWDHDFRLHLHSGIATAAAAVAIVAIVAAAMPLADSNAMGFPASPVSASTATAATGRNIRNDCQNENDYCNPFGHDGLLWF